jgi:long-chain-fatty-acid--CoA ligase ACSBG
MKEAGTEYAGTELKIVPSNPGDEEGKTYYYVGEICYRGRHIFMGYFKNPEETAKSIDADGFLHSGDIGRIDANGVLFITGRVKELLITAAGENIPPVLI